MKDTDDFFRSLYALSPNERIGRDHFLNQGQELSLSRFAYLLHHSHDKDRATKLYTPEAVAEQKAFLQEVHKGCSEHGLSPEQYFPEGKTFLVEQLLRYIDIPAHKHDFAELVFCLSGKCTHIIDGKTYENIPGDFSIIPPGIKHELHATPDCVCLTAKMRKETFVELFSPALLANSYIAAYFQHVLTDSFFRCVMLIRCGEDPFLRETILRIYMQQRDDKILSDLIMKGLWGVFLAYMLQNYQDTISFLVSDVVEHEEMLHILGFIYENYQTITLGETALHFHVSVPYLSTRIHKLTGKTFSEHLKGYRLEVAAHLLRTTDRKLDFICEEVGYKDTAQFIRSFKAVYGMTPLKYRKAGGGEEKQAEQEKHPISPETTQKEH